MILTGKYKKDKGIKECTGNSLQFAILSRSRAEPQTKEIGISSKPSFDNIFRILLN